MSILSGEVKVNAVAADESREAGTRAAGLASVVIACYNDADIVERNVAALARQSFRDFEVIIADDGSREDYGPMLERWAHAVCASHPTCAA